VGRDTLASAEGSLDPSQRGCACEVSESGAPDEQRRDDIVGLLRLHYKAIEAVALKNLESNVGGHEIEPRAGGFRVGAPATIAAL
jgi:hypothetical protein